MARYREVFKTEKYMDDATVTIMSNMMNGLKRRKQLSIWDPIEPSIETASYDSNLSERYKILTKIVSDGNEQSFAQNTKRNREENKFACGTAVKRNVFDNGRPPKSYYTNEPRSHQNIQDEGKIKNSLEEYNLDIQYSKASNRASELSHPKEQINYQNKQDRTLNNYSIANPNLDVQNSGSEILEKTPSCIQKKQGNSPKDEMLLNISSIPDRNIDVQIMESETFDAVANRTSQRSDFTAWCKQRQEQFNTESTKYQLSRQDSKAIPFKPNVKKHREKNSEQVLKNKFTDHAKKYTKSKSEVDLSYDENKKPNHAKKYSKSQSEIDIHGVENKTSKAKKYSKSRSENNLTETHACIKLAGENYDENYELVVDVSDISRIKRKFPKLNDILPDIDTAITEVPHCFEAVTIILRYLFHGQSIFSDLPNATVAVEVLAATKKWEIDKFFSKIYDIFIREILPSSNIKFIFSQASHYNLHEICNACQEISTNGASLKNSTYRRKQKICSISVTTYIEPLEFSIPLYTVAPNSFEVSFEKHILNTIKFEALSGSFTIFGIQIHLNRDHLENYSNNSMLKIDYNTKNLTEKLELGTGMIEKPLRPVNVIHFKNCLEVHPNQVVEITVETDLKPFLCYTYPGEIKIQEANKGGEFCINVSSNYKIPESIEKFFIVGKLLYHVK